MRVMYPSLLSFTGTAPMLLTCRISEHGQGFPGHALVVPATLHGVCLKQPSCLLELPWGKAVGHAVDCPQRFPVVWGWGAALAGRGNHATRASFSSVAAAPPFGPCRSGSSIRLLLLAMRLPGAKAMCACKKFVVQESLCVTPRRVVWQHDACPRGVASNAAARRARRPLRRRPSRDTRAPDARRACAMAPKPKRGAAAGAAAPAAAAPAAAAAAAAAPAVSRLNEDLYKQLEEHLSTIRDEPIFKKIEATPQLQSLVGARWAVFVAPITYAFILGLGGVGRGARTKSPWSSAPRAASKPRSTETTTRSPWPPTASTAAASTCS